jgi:hypothetical protein
MTVAKSFLLGGRLPGANAILLMNVLGGSQQAL